MEILHSRGIDHWLWYLGHLFSFCLCNAQLGRPVPDGLVQPFAERLRDGDVYQLNNGENKDGKKGEKSLLFVAFFVIVAVFLFCIAMQAAGQAFLSLACIAALMQTSLWAFFFWNQTKKMMGQPLLLERFSRDLFALIASSVALFCGLLGMIISGAKTSAVYKDLNGSSSVTGATAITFSDGAAVGFGAISVILSILLTAASVFLWLQVRGAAAAPVATMTTMMVASPASFATAAVPSVAAAAPVATPAVFENKGFRAAALSVKKDLGAQDAAAATAPFSAAPTPTTASASFPAVPAVARASVVSLPGATVPPVAVAAAGSGALPPGWAEGKADDGQVYFADLVTGTSSWERPELPGGWLATQTEEGQIYYVNGLSGATQWERPTDVATA